MLNSKKVKVYFPTDEKFNEFIQISGLTHGLIFPLKGIGKSKYHVSVILRDHKIHFNFNIHITNEKDQSKPFSTTFQFTPKQAEDFFTHLSSVMISAVQRVLKEAFPINLRKGVYLDLSNPMMKDVVAAKDSATAMQTWKAICSLSSKDLSPVTEETKMIFHKKKKKLLVKLQPGKYMYEDGMLEIMTKVFDSDPKLQQIFKLIEPKFKELFETIEKLPRDSN